VRAWCRQRQRDQASQKRVVRIWLTSLAIRRRISLTVNGISVWQVGPGRGSAVVAYHSSNELRLIKLVGTVVAPTPFKPWRRDSPNAGGERRR
jgi:hypothetical protein